MKRRGPKNLLGADLDEESVKRFFAHRAQLVGTSHLLIAASPLEQPAPSGAAPLLRVALQSSCRSIHFAVEYRNFAVLLTFPDKRSIKSGECSSFTKYHCILKEGRGGMKKLAILLATIVFVAIPLGCDIQKSAAEEIEQAASTMDTAEDRCSTIDPYAFEDAKNALAACKSDYEEALRILEGAETDYEEEAIAIELNETVCLYSLDAISAGENYVAYLEHNARYNAAIWAGNIREARAELQSSSDRINAARHYMSLAKARSHGIDIEEVPAEYKGNIEQNRMTHESNEGLMAASAAEMPAMEALTDGFEHWMTGIDHFNERNWTEAEFSFSQSSSCFSESRDIYAELKGSKFTEVAVYSADMYTDLTKVLEGNSCLEAGCRYAAEGDETKAHDEFMKAQLDFAEQDLLYFYYW